MPKELNAPNVKKTPKYLQQTHSGPLSVFYKLDVGCCVALLKNYLYLYLRILSTIFKTKVGNGNRIVNN